MVNNQKNDLNFENIDLNDAFSKDFVVNPINQETKTENSNILSQTKLDVPNSSSPPKNQSKVYVIDEKTLQKIDYIYKTLKYQKIQKNITRTIKFWFLLIILYAIFFYLPSLSSDTKGEYQDKANWFITEYVSSIVKPIVTSIAWDISKDLINWTWSQNSWVNVDENTIKSVANSLNKIASWTTMDENKAQEVLKKYNELKQKQQITN